VDREKALNIYRILMKAYGEASLLCVDLSEEIKTHGISPLYELQVKGKVSDLREVLQPLENEGVVVTETNEGIHLI
jgi:hypothetical protein